MSDPLALPEPLAPSEYDGDRASHLTACLTLDAIMIVDKATAALRYRAFDAIVCQGVSGIAFGARLADRLRKNLIVVRKPDEKSHSPRRVENAHSAPFTFIFVDDFPDSGSTTMRVLGAMSAKTEGRCVGIWFYDANDRGLAATKYYMAAIPILNNHQLGPQGDRPVRGFKPSVMIVGERPLGFGGDLATPDIAPVSPSLVGAAICFPPIVPSLDSPLAPDELTPKPGESVASACQHLENEAPI